MTQVNLPNGRSLNYKYDALGRRIQRTTRNGANERYVYDGNDVLLDLNADWSVATTYLNGPGIDNHLRQTSATTGVSYYLTDHLGSTAALTDATGNIVEQLTYDSFGNSSGSSLTRYTYTGREFDSDTGLYYYRARFYDPQVGRFISEDPIGFAGGMNRYSYVGNNPVDSSDPLGLRPLPRSRTGTRECNPAETAACGKICGAKGVQSCRISQTFRIVRWKDGKSLWKWVDGPMSCSCNDCEEKERKRVPVPNPRPWEIPTMEEFRLQEESAQQMHSFWKKVLYGDLAVGAVVLAPEGTGALVLKFIQGSWRWVPRVAGPAAAPAFSH